MSQLKPKLFSVMKHYTKEQFVKDVISGVIVAVIALPLSIALAIASGATPEAGLYTAIIGGFIVSFLGGSRVQIAGPTGAFMIIVFGVISKYGLDGLFIATVMAGLIMIFLGITKLGSMIKFIPYPIITGFTSGIALVIFSSQVNDFLGMDIENVPAEFFGKWASYFTHLGQINYISVGIGLLSLLIIIFWPKISKKIPGALVAIVISALLVSIFKLDVATVGSKFGELSSALPTPHIPTITLEKIKMLIPSAFVIAFLGSVESLLSAVVSDGMIGSRHRSNMELIAQGTANIGSALFGGIPVTGAIARTVANIKNGGRTPIAGMVHSITLLLMLVLLMPLVQLVPLSALAAILFMVAYNMSEWREFVHLFKSPLSDVLVLVTTFILTVTVDLVVAIEVGLFLSIFLFMKRMSEVSDISVKKLDFTENNDGAGFDFEKENKVYSTDERIVMYQINGPFFFGAAHKFIEAINNLHVKTSFLIIGMKHVPAMDATALHSFQSSLKICSNKNITVLVTGLRKQPLEAMKKAELIGLIGEDHFFETIEVANKYAVEAIKNN